MSAERWRELAELYAAGALDGTDRTEFEARLEAGDEVCLQYLRESQEVLEVFHQGLYLLEPPVRVREEVLTIVRAEAVAAGPAPARGNPFWAATGVWVLASAFVIVAWQTTGTIRHAEQFQRIETTIMAQPESAEVMLTSLETGSKASAKMVWSAKTGDCVFLTMGLPRSARDKVYQLWGIRGGQPVSAGTFEVDAHGCALMAMKNFAATQFEKFAVTLEPAGGVPQPTGPMVLAGAV